MKIIFHKIKPVSFAAFIVMTVIMSACAKEITNEIVSNGHEITFEDLAREESNRNHYQILLDQYSDEAISQEASEHAAAHKLDGTDTVYQYQIDNEEIGKRIKETSILGQLIDSKWSFERNQSLFTTDTEMYRYYYNNDLENIRYKIFNDKISHVVFKKEYQNEILTDISLNSSKAEIIAMLGTPNYEDAENSIIGYKNAKFYIFFYGESELDEISIYRRDSITAEEIEALLIQHKETNGSDFFTLLQQHLPSYDFITGISGNDFIGYEAAGLILNYSEADDRIILHLYGEACEMDLPNLLDSATEVVLHDDSDAVFDLERYRILVEQFIKGTKLHEKYSLGMAFDSYVDRFLLSPDTKKGLYIKSETIDDNYSCIYITDLTNDHVHKELPVDAKKSDIYWVDSRYIACMGEEASYLYDLKEDKKLSLPNTIDGSAYKIERITEAGIVVLPL